jgi:hypothetical protein
MEALCRDGTPAGRRQAAAGDVTSRPRCGEQAFLEFHHVKPFAAGGAATDANIELRCRAHNAYEAALFFGPETADAVRERITVWG